ncbi:MAG: hypothetical protein NC320_12375 [Clostridium sp.]|nr:hypothetical protein [Clostridium sp.]MCM1546848.1 hypothetical protein [Ruminococcus sp.]
MKSKRIIAVLCMTAAVLTLYGCGGEEESSARSESSASSASENESSLVEYTSKIEAPTANIKPPAEKISNSTVNINGSYTGIMMDLPEGIKIYDGEESLFIFPMAIPTSSEPLIVSDDKGNTVNIIAMDKADEEEFSAMSREDIESMLTEQMGSVFDSFELIDYSTGTYDGFSGMRIDMATELSGVSMLQTAVFVNAVKDGAGCSYVITYTDIDGDMQDKIEKSISTLSFSTKDLFYGYDTLSELVKAQKDGIFDPHAAWRDRVKKQMEKMESEQNRTTD